MLAQGVGGGGAAHCAWGQRECSTKGRTQTVKPSTAGRGPMPSFCATHRHALKHEKQMPRAPGKPDSLPSGFSGRNPSGGGRERGREGERERGREGERERERDTKREGGGRGREREIQRERKREREGGREGERERERERDTKRERERERERDRGREGGREGEGEREREREREREGVPIVRPQAARERRLGTRQSCRSARGPSASLPRRRRRCSPPHLMREGSHRAQGVPGHRVLHIGGPQRFWAVKCCAWVPPRPPYKSCGRPRHIQTVWSPTSGHAQVRPRADEVHRKTSTRKGGRLAAHTQSSN